MVGEGVGVVDVEEGDWLGVGAGGHDGFVDGAVRLLPLVEEARKCCPKSALLQVDVSQKKSL